MAGEAPCINGDDYPTPDGTCVRDYVHVSDLAVSHVAAAKALEEGRPLEPVYNLGSGNGLSVRQIMDAVARVTGIDFPPNPAAATRRSGRIVATGELAARDLDWQMRHTVDEMVASAWAARQAAEYKDDQKWSPATEISSDLLLFLTTFVGTRVEQSQSETLPTHCLRTVTWA